MNMILYLRAFEYDDLPFINKLQEPDTFSPPTCGGGYFTSQEKDSKWIEDKIFHNYKQLHLMICGNEGDEPIGYVGVENIDYINRRAELAGVIIDKDFRGKGYGTEGMKLIMKHMYFELGMNVLYGYVNAEDAASDRIIEKLGLHKDGLLRSWLYKQDKYCDAVLVSMLKAEFEVLVQTNNTIS